MTALKSWLADTGTTQVSLSRRTGIDQALLSKYARGQWRPGLLNALLIERATDGAVPVDSWVRSRSRRVRKCQGEKGSK